MQNPGACGNEPWRRKDAGVAAATLQRRNWQQAGLGPDAFGGAQRKMLRLAPAASPADGEGAPGEAAAALNLRGASLSRAGEVQVPGRAALTCACSAPWGDAARGSAPGNAGKYPPGQAQSLGHGPAASVSARSPHDLVRVWVVTAPTKFYKNHPSEKQKIARLYIQYTFPLVQLF